ncbi:sensor histidine kinase [Paenibacillus sp. J5C_2022]|nr:sensor histidine kinase [Paenibacillus sp. J5C2022]
MERQVGEFVPQILSQVSGQIESYVNELLMIPQSIFYLPGEREAADIFRSINEAADKRSLRDTLQLHSILNQLNFRTSENLQAITYYSLSGDAYLLSKDGGKWVEQDYRNQHWYADLDLEYNSPAVLGTYQDNLLLGKPYVFSIIQPIRGSNRQQIDGIIKISGSIEAIGNMIDQVDFGAGSVVYVLDHRNHVVYSTAKRYIGQTWNDAYGVNWSKRSVGSDTFELAVNGKPYLFSYNWSTDSGWKVVGLIPSENMSKGIYQIKSWTYILVATSVLIVIGLAVAIAYGFTKPLRKLSDKIKHLDISSLNEQSNVDRLDEIGYLSSSFHNMIKRMNSLFGEVLHEKVLKQEAEIKALQSQINPHFMHNALETIRMTYKTGRHENGEQGLISLGHVLRYQAAQEKERIAIPDEVEFLIKYLSLQKLRFGERLSIQMDVNLEVKKHTIPCMILQPLIENALKYGISPFDHTISLTIRLRVEEAFVVGEVIDEGKGMTPERLEQVIAQMQSTSRSQQSRIGLANVYQRLRLLFGPAGELSIESQENVGTIVRFQFPYQ